MGRGLAPSRNKAQALIRAGAVYSGTTRLDAADALIAESQPLDVRGGDHPWVSRGGVKLAHALDSFAIDPAGLIVLDVGASTGGFTDVVLTRGAKRVYAVDVGHGQLVERLRDDPRVVTIERVNARHLTREHVSEPADLIVCDVSFISLTLVLPAAFALAAPDALAVVLIKPQFEVGREGVGKAGIVRNPSFHRAARDRVTAWVAAQPGWSVTGTIVSPIAGSSGNREFLMAARRSRGPAGPSAL